MKPMTSDPEVHSPEDPVDALAQAQNRASRYTHVVLWVLAGGFLVFSSLQLGVVPERLLEAGERFSFIADVMLPPVIEDRGRIWNAVIESIQVAIVGTVFGVALSLFLATLAAKNISPIGMFSWLIKGFAALVRAVPALIFALLFIVAVGIGPVPGILAILVNSTGMLVKAYAESIEEMPMAPIEALRAAGASNMQVVFQGVLPSVIGTFISWSIFRLDINMRYASVLGIVGAGGIGWELIQPVRIGQYDRAVGVTLVIFAMIMATEAVSQWLRKRVA